MSRRGIAFIGDSNTEITWMGPVAMSIYPKPYSWACKLCTRLGMPGWNFGVSGAITYDFNAGTNPYNAGLANPNDPRLSQWRASNAKYFLIALGYNDPANTKYPPPIPADYAATKTRFVVEQTALANAVLSLGGTPILIGLGKMDFPSHSTSDFSWWSDYDSAKIAIAASLGIGYIDIATPMAAAIAGGAWPDGVTGAARFQTNAWDFHIRSDGVTLDAINDAAHAGDPDKSWWTNLHYNYWGTEFMAVAIKASGLVI